MAAPAYTTDLTTLAIGSISVDAGTWSESTDAGWDTGGSMVDDSNLYYNGTACVSAQLTKDASGTGATGPASIMYEHTSTVTVPTDGAVLIHHLWAAPPALNTIANGGVHIMGGNSPGIFDARDISGSDFLPAPKGGWANYAINPGIGTPDDTVGGGATTPFDTFGMAVSATAQARGNPNAVNAVRYGRCESRFTDGDIANGYATFEGYGDVDATSTNKWSLIDPVEGGYKFQGLMSLGLTATSVDFRDSNVNISIANTIAVTSPFNAIEVHNATSNVEWTAINITALGTVSKGTFEMIDNATVAKTDCVFTDMNTFIYQSNATLTTTTYRRTGQVTQSGATFDACKFDSLTSAVSLVVDSLADVTDCTFTSDGSNHAIDLGTVSVDVSMSWGNYTSGYAVAHGATGNEAILVSVDSGITLTINVGQGYDLPYYYNTGLGTVNVVSSYTLTVTDVPTGVQMTVVNSSTRAELQNTTSTGVDITYDHSGGEIVDILFIANGYDPNSGDIYDLTLPTSDSSIKSNIPEDLNYENP